MLLLGGEGEGNIGVLVVVATLTVMVLVRVLEGEACWALREQEDGILLWVSKRSLGDSPASRSGTGVRWSEGELNTTCRRKTFSFKCSKYLLLL